MTTYADFLASKDVLPPMSGRTAGPMTFGLFPFQAAIARWAVARGRCAIFADTGLGKTRMQIAWAREIGTRALIVAPLGVVSQTIAEGVRIGAHIEAVGSSADICSPSGTYITNYEKLHRFDPALFDAVVLDESSILKSQDGKTRQRLIADWTAVPFRLCCTATPAPNDLEELANHAEFVGVMKRAEMLATFFVHDENKWRLKGHAREAFFRWMASWAMYIRRPSDLGFEDAGFALPALRISDQQVEVSLAPDGELFPAMSAGIRGRHIARRASLPARVAQVVELVQKPGQWLVWCGLNDEARRLAGALGDECVNIEGADSDEEKIAKEQAWREGRIRILATKPSIFGFGMNWQHCHQMAFLGLGDSWEQYYQSIRRCWRFGQEDDVDVVIVTSEAEGRVTENVWRKEREAQETAAEVIAFVKDAEREAIGTATRRDLVDYQTDVAEGEHWRLLLGDCVERLGELDAQSVHLSVHSPPFASLYTYSASDRDMGNSRDYEQFFEHYRFAAQEILRATLPGRRACVHVQQVTTTKTTHGVIGWRDFRADVVKLYQDVGWVYDGEVVIDKDPQAQAIRTKSKALMFIQKERDASWLRPAMADYILLFRAPGDNSEPVHGDVSNEEWILWARPIWYGIRETATLQAAMAREERDEKHIAPLQLETIERCIRLWSNPGDLILDPMCGIGSTGYVAVRLGRRFVGVELKPEYWQQAVENLKAVSAQPALISR